MVAAVFLVAADTISRILTVIVAVVLVAEVFVLGTYSRVYLD